MGATSLDLDPPLLPFSVKIPQGGAWAQPVVPVTTSQISEILLIFLQVQQGWVTTGGHCGQTLRADRSWRNTRIACPRRRTNIYAKVLHSATPAGAKDREVLRLDRPPSFAERL